MAKPGQHVVPSGNGWSVRKSGADRASGRFATQKEAVASATTIAKNQRTEVYVHGKDGRIRERNSYGHDPAPRRG